MRCQRMTGSSLRRSDMRLVLRATIAATALAAAAPLAIAQSETAAVETVNQMGSVTSLSTEIGSVIVVRDGELYSLAEGDVLIEGDIIQTLPESAATPGTATLMVGGCEQVLEPGEQIVVNAAFCDVTPVALTGEQITALGGLPAAPPGIGAAGIIGGAVAAAAAAVTATNDDTPASP